MPRIAPFDFGNEPSNSGDSASVQCLVTSGDFPIDFSWLFNQRPVSEIFGISTAKLGKRTYALTIDSVNGKHAGNYTCEASNMAGVDRYSSALIVNGTSVMINEGFHVANIKICSSISFFPLFNFIFRLYVCFVI